MKIAITTAAALLAASSFAFAASDNGGNNAGNGVDATATGSISRSDRVDPPDQKVIEDCMTAPASDQNCQNAIQSR